MICQNKKAGKIIPLWFINPHSEIRIDDMIIWFPQTPPL